ncbi:MAG TPA: hypothetical protein VLF59_01370 [Candidatus Saccharimonadales bacterium]|nr:hypothetical protein [Candidatus Saccharimonadales bacterium]
MTKNPPTVINIDSDYAEANVYRRTGSSTGSVIYLVKVSFTDIRLFISAIRVQQSKKDSNWWVQLPVYKVGYQWVKPFETSGDSPFFKLVEQLAIQAVEKDIADNPVFDDELLGRPITVEDIPDVL